MRYSSDVNYNGFTRVSFGAPAAASATNILSAQDIASAGSIDLTASTYQALLDAPYGRALQVVASGAATSTVTIKGFDYLGQPMSETLTLNGATPVLGKKAFKYLYSASWTGTAATTINLGTQNVFGLPYKAIKCDHETSDQALVTAGTLAAPVLTDPQTATTGDPRGTYTPTTTPNGSKVLTADFLCQNDVNSSNRGGLHGIAHYTA
jgi:hypothetical protein